MTGTVQTTERDPGLPCPMGGGSDPNIYIRQKDPLRRADHFDCTHVAKIFSKTCLCQNPSVFRSPPPPFNLPSFRVLEPPPPPRSAPSPLEQRRSSVMRGLRGQTGTRSIAKRRASSMSTQPAGPVRTSLAAIASTSPGHTTPFRFPPPALSRGLPSCRISSQTSATSGRRWTPHGPRPCP